MVELGWITTEATQEPLQNLMSKGYMTAAELMTCHVPEDPASPILAGGYVVACAAFYEWGFCVPAY
jgi:hypothetical protein